MVLVACLPTNRAPWALLVLPLLFALARLAEVPIGSLARRWLWAQPFLLGLACLSYWRPHGLELAGAILVKSSVSVLSLSLLVETTSLPALLSVLRRIGLPAVFCDTLALLDRYWLVLAEESRRMQRARSGRLLGQGRWSLWQLLANSLGLLFVRSVARAERVQAAMRARGAP